MNLTQTQSMDLAHVWHPCVQAKTAPPPFTIKTAKGIELIAENGRVFWDLISSWWVNLHGHAHPKIANAIAKQAQQLEHVVFTDFTHEPAVELCKELTSYLPLDLSKIFFSDNGSCAVEVALKIARQYWYNQGKTEKKRFISFEKGYHGDTFGSMSVGMTSGYYQPFEDLLFPVFTVPYPHTWVGDQYVDEKEAQALQELTDLLEKHHQDIAAFILEPCIQGAAGIRMCRPEFIKKITEVTKKFDVLVIFDEVVTGFGRTGEFFACIKASISPDIICLAKGLTGGFLSLAITATTEKIYTEFLGDDYKKAFLHGHSYTANPLCCAAALASLEIFKEEKTIEKIALIEQVHYERVIRLKESMPIVRNCRIMGDIAAFDAIGSKDINLKSLLLAEGLFLRPLGDTVYLMPPYCISLEQLNKAYDIIEDVLMKNCSPKSINTNIYTEEHELCVC
jgi:adenosylmethionine-8-amino-7-oxononanoate aminotransferase